MKKVVKFGLFSVIVIVVGVVIYNYPRLNIITGFSAKSVCSCTFEANRGLASIEKGDNGFSPINLATNKINFEEKSVTSTVFGLKARKAIYKKGIGCVLLSEGFKNEISFKPNRHIIEKKLPYPFGVLPQKDTVFRNVNYKAVNKAVENTFDKTGDTIKKTRAVLVIYNNKIIAEKYAEGFDKNSKFLGWSMTKSITSAVVGVLVKKRKVNINQSNLFSEWKNDQRSKITLNNLLQMNSGLEWVENYNTISDVTKMLYLDEDMTKIPLEKTLVSKPDSSWNYSSGTTNLISKYIRNQFKTHQEYLDFWYQELIDKIGMSSMVIETDVAGNYIGSSYGWATARDWAKFGLLYLHKGNWNGDQILTEDWIDYTVQPTPTSNGEYGAQFWLNAGGVYPDVPKDLFSCNGYQGQYVFIIPSKKLVVVRFGLAENPIFNTNQFLSSISKSIDLEQ